MAKRRIVADTAVIAAGYGIPAAGAPARVTHRAKAVVKAIRDREVHAFAPEILVAEMFKVIYDAAFDRKGRSRITDEQADGLVYDFQRLPIVYRGAYQPARRPLHGALGAAAWNMMRKDYLSPSDSWFVACARYYDAELWVSHPHGDGLLDNARRVHEKTYALSEQTF